MNIRKAQPEDHHALLAIWEQSVRASHDFLSEQDIRRLLIVVRDQALPCLEVWVLCDETETPIGFMGLSGNKLEALFIAPARFRQGAGKLMLHHARKLKGRLLVDVNEQNPQALAFYERQGFRVVGRSALDGQGKPYPLLHMEWRGDIA